MHRAASTSSAVSIDLDQALTQAIAQHQAGKIQAAEHLYRTILQKQPNHPQANHHLGVLAVQLGRPGIALPHLRAATQADPVQNHYWWSYLDALMQTGQQITAQQELQERGPKDALSGMITRSTQPHERTTQKTAGKKADQPNREITDKLIQLFQAGRYLEAAALAHRLTARYPSHGFSWKVLGAALARMGQRDATLAAMRQAAALLPADAEAHNNLGNTLRNMGHPEEARASFLRALKLRPDLAAIHNNLGNALRDLGQPDAAENSFRKALQLNPALPEAHNNLGIVLQAQGRLQDAEASFRQALTYLPEHVQANHNLGSLLLDNGELKAALAHLQTASRQAPNETRTLNLLGLTLRELRQRTEAREYFLKALSIQPDFADAHNNLGIVQGDLEELDAAADSFRQALEINPDHADAHSNLGNLLIALGKTEEARTHLFHAIALAPEASMPLSTAILLLSYREDDPRFSRLEPIYAARASLPVYERIKLNFAMGKAMETRGYFERAFKAYAEGNQLHYLSHPFDDAADQHMVDTTCSQFSAEQLARFNTLAATLPPVSKERTPVFIVGMPRSGTSLIEQILASHPSVHGAGELTVLSEQIHRADAAIRQAPDNEAALAVLRQAGQDYLDQVWCRSPGAAFITDKMPENFFHIGLIQLMLPQARIIHTRRDALDTCFSCFSTLFRCGHEYSYNLETLGRRYLRYEALMAHWRKALPAGTICEINYEDMVADQEGETRRLLDYLGLNWDPACLTFHQTERTVNTASASQVRQPIYTGSVARWQRFEADLTPLRQILNR
jgi:tetratricopeptide (TPR) repeat protein